MAPVASTVLSHSDGISDSARARELYKYFQPTAPVNTDDCFPTVADSTIPQSEEEPSSHRNIPVSSDVTSSKISSPDTALTAFCQLVTWRTGAQRAMIGLIDAETQYFIAESTKTLDLVDAAKHAPGDDIWMGCSSVSKAGKLCERTIAVRPTNSGEYPCFIVNDLTKDERFNQLPFVVDPPNLKFYCGVPLITKRGIPIGSLFIVDDQVRDGMSRDDIHFMGTMAQTIMKHLEMTREVEQHRRGMKMSRGLACFVEGRAEIAEAEMDVEDTEGTKIAGQFETELDLVRTKSKSSHRNSVTSVVGSVVSIGLERRERESSSGIGRAEQADTPSQDGAPRRPELSSESQGTSHASLGTTASGTAWSPRSNEKSEESPASMQSEESSQKRVCSRAANLIRETFEVDGGCLFYDAQVSFGEEPHRSSDHIYLMTDEDQPESQNTSGDEHLSSGETTDWVAQPPIPIPIHADPTLPPSSPGLPGVATFSRSSTMSRRQVQLLGFSTPDACSIHGDALPGNQSFKPLEEKALHTLLRRYPRGKLWTFDSDGGISSSSEEDSLMAGSRNRPLEKQDGTRRKARNAKTKADAKFLSKHFPGVRQLLFVPLWDAGRSRWLSGCFVWSTELTRILSKQSELSFLTAFGNSVMAEWSRIDTEIANQKKGDFIGSISHELRSPLHGILASAEFLSDEVKSTFETSMVETIASCGRTLLDTINHVLDFSKINHFERTWRKGKRGTRSSGAMALKQSELPMINLYADVDIATVCEEVVEGVYAGHLFQSGTAANFDMVRDSREKLSSALKSPSNIYPIIGQNIAAKPEVTLIFDVDTQDYHFTTQPGAFRRVVMNLLGNALKYTSHGYVRVTLTASDMDDFNDMETGEVVPRSMVVLTVADTGKGIAPEFLRSKLFTPFAQENSLSSGTGLGLAIVKSIVHILEGDITIDSEVGRGTQVRVSLPLLRGVLKGPDSVSTNTPKSIVSATREPEESLVKLRARILGQRVSLHGFHHQSPDPIAQKAARYTKTSVTNFLIKWFGMQVVPLGQKTSLIISNDASSANISKLINENLIPSHTSPSIIVLCSYMPRAERVSLPTNSKFSIGYVTKPVGPIKLGKAIAQCFDGSDPSTPGLPSLLDSQSITADSNDLSNVFEEMTLSPKGAEMLDNSRMAADSDNARKAIESPTPNALAEKADEFPFPAPSSEHKAALPKVKSLPSDKDKLKLFRQVDGFLASAVLTNKEPPRVSPTEEITPIAPQPPALTMKYPSFLLVDDNAINLTLLRTSIKKRKHEVIDQAMDGLAAVRKFQEREVGYDVIFMDISMPLLDGFGATKEIRTIEESRKAKFMDSQKDQVDGAVPSSIGSVEETMVSNGLRKPALVIAITGLASSDDQARAASVGVDLFLTKPVSFKDVKKMLDNWEANRLKDGGM
ncbi:histidine kinase-group I protein [Tricladium varicosporioides]|nr:histidine kinase-group I protein [Hymenoscyphus varicosporioides]